MKRFARAGIVVAAMLATGAFAQSWPSRPIRLTIPTSPGSSQDMVARVVASKLAESLGQPVVAETRAGANGFIGAEYVARAAPDGYNLMINTSSSLVIPYFVTAKLPFDPRRDFTPITAAVESLTVMAVHPSVPAQSVKELVEHIRRNPGKLSYSSPGVASLFHLMGALFQNLSAPAVHVPYKGAAPAVTAAEAGEVQFLFTATNNVIPLHKAGKLRALAVMGNARFPALTGVPAMSEAYPAMANVPGWFAFFGPAALPAPIIARLHADIVKALQGPEVRAKFEAGGLRIIANTPEEFAVQYAQTFDLMGAIVKDAGLKAE